VTREPLTWAGVAVVAPSLAAAADELLARYGFVFVGTVRADGTPRICPVEAHLVHGHLMLVMVAASRKSGDLVRDPRLTIQTPVVDPHQPGAELKVRGIASGADDELRAATAAAIEATSGWRPPYSWRFVDVAVWAAALLSWTPDGDLVLTRWDMERGLRTSSRRLDRRRSRYRPKP
jgi:Pyridoxamine 5'-phosphate oxidase